MATHFPPIILAEELFEIKDRSNLILIDADGASNGYELYLQSHPKGARHVSLNSELAQIPDDFSKGGRHPFPDLQAFGTTLRKLGIEPTSHVVVYDRSNAANAAARFWFMLHSVGHKRVQVLNGGFKELVKVNFPLESGESEYKELVPYPVQDWSPALVNIEYVEQAMKDPNQVLVDVRDAYRYNGESEPIDLVAGHIPGAINIPFSENLDEQGLYHQPEYLYQKYQEFIDPEKSQQAIIHCGSGVTACHTLLALASAGYDLPKLYVGSWSEWSRNKKQESE